MPKIYENQKLQNPQKINKDLKKYVDRFLLYKNVCIFTYSYINTCTYNPTHKKPAI